MNSTVMFLCNSLRYFNGVISAVGGSSKNIDVLQCADDLEAIHALPEVRKRNPAAIVALPVTGKELAGMISTPVVLLDPAPLDFLEAFLVAKQYSPHVIPYIGYAHHSLLDDLHQLELMLDAEIKLWTYTDNEERKKVLARIPHRAIDLAVVTSDSVGALVQSNRGRAIMVKWRKHAILSALRTATQLVSSKREEVDKNRWLQLLLDNINDGVISSGGEDKIAVFNKRAGAYLGISPREIIGEKIGNLPENHILKTFMRIDQEAGSQICTYKDKTFLVNKTFLNPRQQIVTFKDESEIVKLQTVLRRECVKKGMVAKYKFADIIGSSKKTENLIKIAQKYAQSNITLLIIGETGVGKEVYAQSIHNFSNRRTGPFVAINCATIPENILESELFGYEGGSFTGALKEGKKGLFELANGGTIFLDEIAEMSASLQARLLRVVQNKEIMHLGGDNLIPIDVRIIAATNQDLQQAILDRTFRQDLYYRLFTLQLHITPLREHMEDIPELVGHFLRASAVKFQKTPPKPSQVFLKALMEYHWPGNIRQLESVIERYALLYDEEDDEIAQQLIQELTGAAPISQRSDDKDNMTISIGSLKNMEKQIMRELSERYKIGDLAQLLEVSRTTLWRKLGG